MAGHQENADIEGHGFRNLLFILLVYIFGSPFLAPYPSLDIFAHVSLSIALFVAVYTVQKKQKQRTIAIALLLPMLVVYWLGTYDIIHFTRPGSYTLIAVYFAFLVYSYIQQIFRSRRITMNVLYMTFCLYLIIALFWGALYALFYEISPSAYSGVLLDKVQGHTLHVFNYFSLVTLTTLGYGDITPQVPGAAALCQMEAIAGQFFTAVLVAWFVGIYVSDKQAERLKKQDDF
jgi:hypothetical protein